MRVARALPWIAVVGFAIAGTAATGPSCSSELGFVCSDDAECGDRGVCQPNRFCSLADETCASGQRYDDQAGELAGLCVGKTQGSGDPSGPGQGGGGSGSGGSGGAWSAANGHTEWVCGRAIHIGFTTTFTPNTKVPYTTGGALYDIDVCSRREGSNPTDVTYGVVTSRSYHSGMVNALLMDGSARSIASTVSLATWRALGTRDGGEVNGDF